MEELNELFYKDPYLKSFAATVTSCSEGKNGFEVVLDDTAFLPEGGGQPADHGTLGAAQVTDVRRVKGVIIHYTDKPFEAGTKVEGKIDWERISITCRTTPESTSFPALCTRNSSTRTWVSTWMTISSQLTLTVR